MTVNNLDLEKDYNDYRYEGYYIKSLAIIEKFYKNISKNLFLKKIVKKLFHRNIFFKLHENSKINKYLKLSKAI